MKSSMTYGPSEAEEYFVRRMNFATSPVELHQRMQQGEALNVIDVRDLRDFAKGHIPNARNLPKPTWRTLAHLKLDRVNIIYSYAPGCHLALEAAERFADEGFEVMEMEGGFETWKAHHLPVQQR